MHKVGEPDLFKLKNQYEIWNNFGYYASIWKLIPKKEVAKQKKKPRFQIGNLVEVKPHRQASDWKMKSGTKGIVVERMLEGVLLKVYFQNEMVFCWYHHEEIKKI